MYLPMKINGYIPFLINTLDTIIRAGKMLSGIRAERLILHGRLEAERPPASVGPPSVGPAAALTPLTPFV